MLQNINNNSPATGTALSSIDFQPEKYHGTIGRFMIPINSQLAKTAVRCNPPNETYPLEAWTGVWEQLTVSPYPYDAELMWGVWGPPLGAYWLDGEGAISLSGRRGW
jgi:hypothetical protein